MLGFSANEVYEMPIIEHEAYARWIEKWRPHLIYGASASGGVDMPSSTVGSTRTSLPVTKLPGADIVRAY